MKKQQPSSKKITLAVLGAMLVLLLLDLTPLGGNTYMYAKWIECGNRPIQDQRWMVAGEVPYYMATPQFALVRGFPKYFCNSREAELAGYSAEATGYSFPHLTKDEARSVLEKK